MYVCVCVFCVEPRDIEGDTARDKKKRAKSQTSRTNSVACCTWTGEACQKPTHACAHGRASSCPRAVNGAGYVHRHAARAAPRVLRRALVQRFRLRHLLVGAAGLRPGVGRAGNRDARRSGQARDGPAPAQQYRAPAGLGARASAPFVGSEANELCEQEMGKLHRRAPQCLSAEHALRCSFIPCRGHGDTIPCRNKIHTHERSRVRTPLTRPAAASGERVGVTRRVWVTRREEWGRNEGIAVPEIGARQQPGVVARRRRRQVTLRCQRCAPRNSALLRSESSLQARARR